MELIAYEDKYQPAFKQINLEWLDRYHLTEEHDLEVLNDPGGTLIDRGGCLFLMKESEAIIGSAGLWKENDVEYELVKMTVDPAYQGRGIGKILLEKCISEAKLRKAKKIFLYSNSKLQTALKLYSKYGFKNVAVTGAPFLTADVKMELTLEDEDTVAKGSDKQ